MSKLRNDITNLLSKIPIDFGGGCSISKAYIMAHLIRKYQMKTTLDIGVYRGRSLFPQALSHAQYTSGVVYGVDPWSNQEANENDNLELKEQIDKFIAETDFDLIYRNVEKFRHEQKLTNHCQLIRNTSEKAINYFIDNNIYFDLIHIDGNHDTAVVMKDIELYLPRLKPQGFLVLDDISWDSVKPTYKTVLAHMQKVYERIDQLNDYAVFWNSDSLFHSKVLSGLLGIVGRN